MYTMLRYVGFLLVISCWFSANPVYAQTPELREFSQPQVALWGTILPGQTFAYAGSPDEACRIQHQNWQPQADYRPPQKWSEVAWACDFSVGVISTATLVQASCPEGHVINQGLCVIDRLASPVICNGECGGSPISGTPQLNRGNPINVNSGLKVDGDVDYSSADGLFAVERQYLSRSGHGWQLLLPGYLEIVGQNYESINFYTRAGGKDQFDSTYLADPNNWSFRSPETYYGEKPSRRRISMVTTPSTDRGTFATDTNISPTGPAEVRLDLANGDYILFRRANGPPPASGGRRLVPIEQGKPGGYKVFYDYNDVGYHPYRVRDSLNREMTLTWIDAPGPTIHPSISGTKVIKEIILPDTTRLEYEYDNASLSYIVPIPAWAVGQNLDIRGPSVGVIKVSIEGRKDRMRSATRRSASGTILWQRHFDYDYAFNPSAMTRVRDQNSATLAEYTYVGGSYLATSKLANNVNGHAFQHLEEFPENNFPRTHVRRITGPLGRTDEYWLTRGPGNTAAQPDSLTRIVGAATPTTPQDEQAFEYNGGYQFAPFPTMTKSTDELGRETTYDVDIINSRPVSITQGFGTPIAQNTTLQWHPVWDLPTRVERDGVRVDTTYTADAMVASQTITDLTTHTVPYATTGQSRTMTYNWGPNARLLSVNGPKPVDAQGRDDIVTFAYDTAGNVTSMTNALNHITTFGTYDANGRPGTMTDANGVVTQFTYDLLGRTLSARVKHPTTASLDAITTLTYDIEGRVKTVTAPASAALTMNYDLAGLLKSIVASNGERIDYSHDAMGNVTSQIVKRTNATAASTITRTFDALGRMLTNTLGPGRTWTYAYDKVGNVTNVRTPRNHATANSFDALDRLVSSTMPDAGAPTLAYDARDNVTTHGDAKGVQTTFVRNGFGEAIREVNPDRGTSTYYYNAAGEKTGAIDGRGQRINYSYDILGRIISAVPVGRPAAETRTYTWDIAAITGSRGVGRLARIVDSGTTIEYGYDHRGNATTKRQRIGTGAWATLAFTYDLADRRTQITYPSGRIVNYTFNTLGRVTQVRTKATAAVTTWTTLASGMTYEAFGAITRADYGNGTRMIQSWGNDGRLANRRLERSSDSVRLSSFTYGYDANDNITAITDTLDASKSFRYGYDSLDRMITKIAGQGTYLREDYTFDRNGNRTRADWRTTETAPTPALTDTYMIGGSSNRLTRIITGTSERTFTYDGRGNLTGERLPDNSLITTAYDGHARLTSYGAGGATQAMFYNGEDERIRITTTAAVGLADTRVYIYDLDHRIVGEYGAAGVSDVKAEYIWLLPEVGASGPTGGDDGTGGYMPLAIAKGQAGTLNWVHSHHNAKPIMLTDATGATVAYSGHAVLGFPGQFANAVGLAGAQYYYNYYRDYDDTTGRYIQADPIGLNGDPNPYAYAMGNALRYSDPTGEFVPAILIGIGIGIVADLAIQAAIKKANGDDVTDLASYNWAQVGISGALGAFGGELLVPTLKLTKGCMKFNNVSRRIRRAENLIGKKTDLHHGILPRRWENWGPMARNIVNHPANLRVMPRDAHRGLHASQNAILFWNGMPAWSQGSVTSIGGGIAAELFDGDR